MKILKKISLITCSLMILLSVVAFAAGQTLLTYYGTGIRGRESVNSWSFTDAGKSIRINHTNEEWYEGGSGQQDMKVSVKRKDILGAYHYYGNCNVIFSGVGSFTKDFWINDKGTFKLYFEATEGASCADIHGSVTLN
ncbi:hypothetical protein [Inconstantimicrobium mannanitabidum]|uniref:Uncharacterized protein n=1 Tax=Inconstantimicrobium mannanitabidum TaxID=1604901 RepID=A0ACB5RDL4_9CLOT|nr:hypothetical protein [Clostridium sp. TW13]GKX66887.1 hypothetical protein rsdtw13_21450 [Clostridium sp. TW13]